jgi:hypothetical protein
MVKVSRAIDWSAEREHSVVALHAAPGESISKRGNQVVGACRGSYERVK